MKKITLNPIGIIHSPFKETVGTPIQSVFSKDGEGTVEIFPEFKQGLKDLDGFSHIIMRATNKTISFFHFNSHYLN